MTESHIQKSFVTELSLYPAVRQYLFAIPNGGSRHKLEAISLKAQGVTPGIPDLFLSIPTKKHHGLYLECKSDKGKLTEHQTKKIFIFKEIGYECILFRTSKEGIEVVKEYLGLTNLRNFKDDTELELVKDGIEYALGRAS